MILWIYETGVWRDTSMQNIISNKSLDDINFGVFQVKVILFKTKTATNNKTKTKTKHEKTKQALAEPTQLLKNPNYYWSNWSDL